MIGDKRICEDSLSEEVIVQKSILDLMALHR